jgi:hypothetical protein
MPIAPPTFTQQSEPTSYEQVMQGLFSQKQAEEAARPKPKLNLNQPEF